ncbi:TolC family protein [Pontiella sp.]|uniref:TolC family protein n=1 Tax=Pontiella sp. TaxID=2837462 RepID=UPI003567B4C3
MKRITVLWCGCLLAASGFAQSATLNLEQALELARQHSPALTAARMHTQAAQKAVSAAGLWQNPILHFEAEGIGGDLDGFSDTEYTLAVAQNFQFGGLRQNERLVAQRAVDVVLRQEAERELALMAEVRSAFLDVVSQQEIGTVRAEQEQLGRAFVEVAKARHRAGNSSELAVVQAELALEEIALSQTCCFGDLEAARIRLASLIGLPEKEMGELIGDFYEFAPIEQQALPESHPALRRLDAEIAMAHAEAARAKSKDAANVMLGAGYRYESAGNAGTFVFEASMPLNFVRGGRAEQAAALTRAEALQSDRAELRRDHQQRLATLIAMYNGSRMEAEMLRDRLMPKAEQTYNLSKDGYDIGRFSWFELITAQQQLAEIKVRYIESLRQVHATRAEITKFMKEGI